MNYNQNGSLMNEIFIPKGFSQLIDGLLSDAQPQKSEQRFSLRTDVIERENAFALHIALPGVSREEVKIALKDSQLTISGERKSPYGESEKLLRGENRFGAFSRTFNLPENADAENITAEMKDGVLTVEIGKRDPEAGIRSIEIK